MDVFRKMNSELSTKTDVNHIQTLHLQAEYVSSELYKKCGLQCLLCDENFPPLNSISDNKECNILKHLLMEHKFVIADVNLIADKQSYFEYWKERFQNKPITEFCSVIKTNCDATDLEPSEFYYLLCDILPEDKELREKLQQERLESVLGDQQNEREDRTFSRVCLFCKKQFAGNRAELFNHMKSDHAFSVGHPNNLVYGNEFLDVLESKLKLLQCLYCERFFKSWDILKEHMRKKQHRRINPQNSIYDKYYIINYLELGKNWEALQGDDDKTFPDNEKEQEDWNDWQEEGHGAVCLFCKYSSTNIDVMLGHMQKEHDFSLSEIKSKLNLNFYQQVKLINYIRKQVNVLKCVSCRETFSCNASLMTHMTENGHFSEIEDSDWDQPQYFFPTYENDTLLCMLEDGTEDNNLNLEGATVIPEDIQPQPNSFLLNADVRKELV